MSPSTAQERILSLESTPLLSLVGHRASVAAAQPLEDVYHSFREHPHEFIGVVAPGGRLEGVTSRGKIGFALGSRFGFSLFGRDPVSQYRLADSLVLPCDAGLLEMLARALGRRDEEFFHDVALVDPAGRYCGMVSVTTLVRLQSELIAEKTRLAEEQRQSLREAAALHESESRLRLALEAGRMSAWQIDTATQAVTWSTVVGDNGWTADALPRSLEDFRRSLLPGDRETAFAALDACRARGEPFLIECRQHGPADGSVRWIETRGQPTHGPDGAIRAITGVSIDVTARHHAEELLHAAKEEAERANNAKSEFLSRMSHELRTPLNAILGFGQLLELDVERDPQREGVGHILRAGRHLLGLIDEVLDITRIESGRLELTPVPIDVRALVQESFVFVSLLASHGEVRLENRVEAGCCDLVADRQRLRQVLVNLLSNAVKYNRRGGEVVVACRPAPGGRVRVEVGDTGMGIAPEHVGRLFFPFERLGAEKVGAVEGTGIGLALSKGLTEAMGGTIGVGSVPGQGSVFWVELPAAPAAAPAERTPTVPGLTVVAPPLPVEAAGAAARTVVYVEDNLSNLQLVEHTLGRLPSPVRMLSAADGRRGLELIRQQRPDVVLLDLHLPGMSGEAVLRALRADPELAGIPVLMLSADVTEASRERLRAAGADDYLGKPLDVRHFLRVVGGALAATKSPVVAR